MEDLFLIFVFKELSLSTTKIYFFKKRNVAYDTDKMEMHCLEENWHDTRVPLLCGLLILHVELP